MNVDPICLSSDDDEPPAKKKNLNLSPQNAKKLNELIHPNKKRNDNIICLDSDEDTNSEEFLNNEKSKSSTTSKDPKESTDKETPIANGSKTRNGDNFPENKNKNSETNEASSKYSQEDADLSFDTITLDANESQISDSCSSSDTEYYGEEQLQSFQKPGDEKPEESCSTSIDKSDLLANTDDLPSEAITFLKTCIEMLKNISADPIYKKFPVMIKLIRSLSQEFESSQYLHKFFKKQTKVAKESTSCCIVSFREAYQHLKESQNSNSVELPKKHWSHVRKLEKTMKLLVEKLKQLDEAEIDFDNEDEEDTAYVKHEKYSQRLKKVYEKYCEILQKNPHAGRITYERIDFVSSRFNEINQAISKKYKNNTRFPSYDELSDFLKKVVEEKKIYLSAVDLKIETEMCFKKLGDLLQTRRKKELYETHMVYMTQDDPAKANEELEKKLRMNFKEGKVKIEQVCQEYVKKQEMGWTGEVVDLSESENEDDKSEVEEIE